MRIKTTVIAFAGLLLAMTTVFAEVVVTVGPTPIPRGDAIGERDITVSNGRFAIAFAVDTAPPWGVARGGIVDVALLRDGELDVDIASLADFMPDNWSDWPTTYQRVTIAKQSAAAVTIRTERDWGDVDLETTFHVRDDDSRIHIVTRMTNNGEASLDDLLTGYVVWPDGGHLVEEPVVTTNDDVHSPGGWTAAYDADWLIGLHVPFSEYVTRRGRDRYTSHDLGPGETAIFEALLQIEDDGSLLPMVQTEIDVGQLPSGRIHGSVVSSDGERVLRPAVVVSKNGQPFAWTTGNAGVYELVLPEGDYDVHATAEGYAPGRPRRVTISKASDSRVDFNDVRPPGQLQFRVSAASTGNGLDARITIQDGYKPLIGYFGKDTFFTELSPVGELLIDIAPGSYAFAVSAGGGFTSVPQTVAVDIDAGKAHAVDVEVRMIAAPHAKGWYSADLHHHSDVLDGFTEAEFVLRSQLAAGVDIAFLSDHDSVVNNEAMQALADGRERLFMPGTELSPAWAHFNAYPVDDDESVEIETGQATVQQIFAEARRMGADIIEVNHPYSDYGYFSSHEKEALPGGYDAGYDLVEIGPVRDNKNELTRNEETLDRVWRLWNAGHRKYLAAGSDVHDVWRFESARARTYAYVEGELTTEKFVAALKAGNSFASQGPLIYPDILFGSDVSLERGEELKLGYSVEAASGVRLVELIERGAVVADKTMPPCGLQRIQFAVWPQANTWYSVVITDQQGRRAYSNPIWVTVTE